MIGVLFNIGAITDLCYLLRKLYRHKRRYNNLRSKHKIKLIPIGMLDAYKHPTETAGGKSNGVGGSSSVIYREGP